VPVVVVVMAGLLEVGLEVVLEVVPGVVPGMVVLAVGSVSFRSVDESAASLGSARVCLVGWMGGWYG